MVSAYNSSCVEIVNIDIDASIDIEVLVCPWTYNTVTCSAFVVELRHVLFVRLYLHGLAEAGNFVLVTYRCDIIGNKMYEST